VIRRLEDGEILMAFASEVGKREEGGQAGTRMVFCTSMTVCRLCYWRI